MKIAVDRIRTDEEERIRADIGNLKPLQESIEKVGLINPLIIDEGNTLVAGYRRLQACKNLGIKEVEVSVIECDGDPLKRLDVEVAENFFRKDFTPEEILSTEVKRREIIESRRKKGLFERLWLWFKSLFTATPSPEKNHSSEQKARDTVIQEEHRQKAESEVQTSVGNVSADAGEVDGRDDVRPEPEPKPEPAGSTEKHRHRTDQDHTIKWRTS